MEERLEQHRETDTWRAYKLACALAAALFLAGIILDAFTQPADLAHLATIRISTSVAYFILYLAARRNRPMFKSAYISGVFILLLASTSITSMCLVLDGYQSPYYAGINLVILAAGVLFPWSTRRMALAISSILGVYLLLTLSWAGFKIERMDLLINNLYFLGCTSVIGISSAWMAEFRRRESFSRLYLIEQAHEALQAVLETRQGNIESASHEIVRALKLRDEFLSIASHELKTPVTSLLLQTDFARRRLARKDIATQDPEYFTNLMTSIHNQGRRLSLLIEDMLDVSRIHSGLLKVRRNRFDLNQLAGELVERFAEQAKTAGSRLELTTQDPVEGEWDNHRVEQVITNLITNGIKYGAGKPIEILVTQATDGTGIIQVKDQGIGVEPEHQARIFERFERAISSDRISGLGLGLYITRQIVAAHGGEIAVESKPGLGSVFTVSLPPAKPMA